MTVLDNFSTLVAFFFRVLLNLLCNFCKRLVSVSVSRKINSVIIVAFLSMSECFCNVELIRSVPYAWHYIHKFVV